MKTFLQLVLVGTLLIGVGTRVAVANETDEKPDNAPQSLAEIPESKWQQVYSYRDLQPSYYDKTPLPMQGLAMYYNPGIFERVLKKQIGWGDVSSCEECIGYVALLREGDMDRRVWLQRPGHPAEGPFWVIDQAAPRDVPGLVRRNWVVDVDYQTAMRWRMRGPIPIVVLGSPSEALPTVVEKPSVEPVIVGMGGTTAETPAIAGHAVPSLP